MSKKEFYHIHVNNKYDSTWKENTEFEVDEEFKSMMYQRQITFGTGMMFRVDPENEPIMLTYDHYIELMNERMLQGERIKRDELMQALQIAKQIAYFSNMFKREAALEDFRKDNCPDLPSRLHSIYLSDEESLKYWEEQISLSNAGKGYSIYSVEVYHEPFKTNEQLLPMETNNYINAYKDSRKYWMPKFKSVPTFTNEYLYQGEVKVKERIK